MPDYSIEKEYMSKGFSLVCGIDEAGRGPLCGNVVAAAVILPTELVIPGLNDSKKLSPSKREQLFDVIISSAVSYGIGSATPAEIDDINILNADMLAMHRAIDAMKIKPDVAIVDGNIVRGFQILAFPYVKGDSRSCSIAAASILAKVTRDRMCKEDDEKYPMYGIARHKGYPTKEHMEAVRQYGPSPIHRRSFLKFLDDSETKK